MHRLKFWIGGILVALATTGIAVAAQSASTSTASATFAAKAKRVATRTCVGSDGTYKITHGVYVGDMKSDDPRLNGAVRIQIHSVYNTDEKAGWMRGEVQVRNGSAEGRAKAHLSAVNLDGNVEGMLTGAAGPPRAHLLANFVATYTPDAFTEGMLGGGGSANETLLWSGACSDENATGKDSARDTTPTTTDKPSDTGQKPERPKDSPRKP